MFFFFLGLFHPYLWKWVPFHSIYKDRCSGAGPHLFNGSLQLFLVLVGAQVGYIETASVEVIFSPIFFFNFKESPVDACEGKGEVFRVVSLSVLGGRLR